jgi:hypothetical protein
MRRRANGALLLAMILLALPAGCVPRVAPHDEGIAAGLATLQSSLTRFFDTLQLRAGTPDAAWECHAAWYEETRAEIAALRVRAAVYGSRNAHTTEALALLEASIDELESAHAAGLSAGQIPVLRALFDSQLRMLIQFEAAKKRTEVSP